MRYLVVASVLLVVVAANALSAREASQQDRSTDARQSVVDGSTKVELNTADLESLESLPGIGPRTAQLIVEYRTEAGGFKKIEELMNVRGIGETTFLRLRELVHIDEGEQGR